MTPHRLTRRDARRVAVRAQLLAAPRPDAVLEVVRHLTIVQIDPTAAIAPNADLVLWSRLGSAYDRAELAEHLRAQRLVELGGYVRPAEDVALFRDEMAHWPLPDERARTPGVSPWQEGLRDWVAANDDARLAILDKLEDEGPLLSRDLPDLVAVPWRSSGWTNDKNMTRLLELMAARGEVAIAGRRGRERLWDLADRVYADALVPPYAEARLERRRRRLASLGIARARTVEGPGEPWDVGEVGEPAVVEGLDGEWRVDPTYLDGAPFRGRVAFVPPHDRLIHDRRRMGELWDFDYQLEMYKPAAKRRWGYFALPILDGDRLVGKLDARAEPKEGVLHVFAVHQDEPFAARLTRAVDAEIADLAAWLGLERYDAAH